MIYIHTSADDGYYAILNNASYGSWSEFTYDSGWIVNPAINITQGECGSTPSNPLIVNISTLCLTGTTDSSFSGTYYVTTFVNNSNLPAFIWYNPKNEYYLSPWKYPNGTVWRLNMDYNDSQLAGITCLDASSS